MPGSSTDLFISADGDADDGDARTATHRRHQDLGSIGLHRTMCATRSLCFWLLGLLVVTPMHAGARPSENGALLLATHGDIAAFAAVEASPQTTQAQAPSSSTESVGAAPPSEAPSLFWKAGAFTLVCGLALLALRRRLARKTEGRTISRAIGWKDWHYQPALSEDAEFDGELYPEISRAWPVRRVYLNGTDYGKVVQAMQTYLAKAHQGLSDPLCVPSAAALSTDAPSRPASHDAAPSDVVDHVDTTEAAPHARTGMDAQAREAAIIHHPTTHAESSSQETAPEVILPGEPSPADRCLAARKSLRAGSAQEALRILAPLLASPEASDEAWSLAGWCWWHVAQEAEADDAHALAQATQAFEYAIRQDAGHGATLSPVLIRCHLSLADHAQGRERQDHLDAALHLMDGNASYGEGAERNFVMERVRTQYERALFDAPATRSRRLKEAQDALSSLALADMNESIHALLVNIHLAQAESDEGRDADEHMESAARLLEGMLRRASPESRDTWMARVINVEVVRLQRMTAAAKLIRLRQLRNRYEPQLAHVRSMAPLLSWVLVLREWAGMVSAPLARAKLAEVEPLFERIAALSPDHIASVQFARAYYLRLRSMHEPAADALATLDAGDALLAHIQSPAIGNETVALERAEIALARADLLKGAARDDALLDAIRLSSESIDTDDGNLQRALACQIRARLNRSATQIAPVIEVRKLDELAQRLAALSPYDPEALQLAAHGHLAGANPREAVRIAEAAWAAGRRDGELLNIWRDALTQASPDSTRDPNDAQWKHLNRCVRLARASA